MVSIENIFFLIEKVVQIAIKILFVSINIYIDSIYMYNCTNLFPLVVYLTTNLFQLYILLYLPFFNLWNFITYFNTISNKENLYIKRKLKYIFLNKNLDQGPGHCHPMGHGLCIIWCGLWVDNIDDIFG